MHSAKEICNDKDHAPPYGFQTRSAIAGAREESMHKWSFGDICHTHIWEPITASSSSAGMLHLWQRIPHVVNSGMINEQLPALKDYTL
jgi:hypothetical protein